MNQITTSACFNHTDFSYEGLDQVLTTAYFLRAHRTRLQVRVINHIIQSAEASIDHTAVYKLSLKSCCFCLSYLSLNTSQIQHIQYPFSHNINTSSIFQSFDQSKAFLPPRCASTAAATAQIPLAPTHTTETTFTSGARKFHRKEGW